uniref:Signal peptidase complex subunit 2 n=1 Tax=Caligus rogercresseyi TaxID=217165 RepID=C1BNV3_CALRO|nr:Probable signal peptidase complex subunit 2 [Caligus rogercresseyi]|eukprot:TRINITY_DN2225_c0_g1_i1.p1 TRINITY_DN2225_c0_g1~~TRINITY_DN2225_c0_g1_i1.p1  ORF type:complete len:191 (-),score=60.11 TRINITY_DN2225_c0_g1_i1:131-703(-)
MASKKPVEDPVKICKWDGIAVKNALDDGIRSILINALPYTEDVSLLDGRLFICATAVAVAMFALLWDFLYPFPLSRPVLIFCVGTYFFLMVVFTLYTTYKIKGIFGVFIQKDPAGLDPDCRWEASSNMKKFDDMYELTLTFSDGNMKRLESSLNTSVGAFFDENGVLCMDLLQDAVLKLHGSIENDKKEL